MKDRLFTLKGNAILYESDNFIAKITQKDTHLFAVSITQKPNNSSFIEFTQVTFLLIINKTLNVCDRLEDIINDI